MTDTKKPLGITDVILRDAHQSILATRMRLDDMLPIAGKLDQVGFWSVESWGGATFDACIRYLGEDPWERIRALKKAMPNTRQQMLLRGQNLLGYRHYADDVVEKFVERAAVNGVDVFRVFDAMNDPRNLETALKAVKKQGKHAQGTISYTTSPVHTLQMWVDLAKQIEDMGADSIAIKDMAGILNPYVAFDLVSQLKSTLSIPVHMQCHATAGLSTAAIMKAAEAGIDNVDSAISSMSMTYGHSPTESVVAIFQNTERDTGLNLELLEEVAAYFREVRKKYAKFEGNLKGVDSRILVAQVPGGMLTNMENQLKEQGASDKFDAVLAEIPRVREDLGFIPLVTPTSQIVGTQAVINVLTGERYKSITKETAGVLKGEYGAAPAPFNAELQARVLDGAEAITCRPADLLEAEMDKLTAELKGLASEKGIKLAENEIDDVLTYALFPQIGLKFLENRGNPDAFEPVPTGNELPAGAKSAGPEAYTVSVNGKEYVVQVTEGGDISGIKPLGDAAAPAAATAAAPAGDGEPQGAPLSGNIFKVLVAPGDQIEEGDVVMILEAMKMETEVRAVRGGSVVSVNVKVGDAVAVGDTLLTIG
ncbi:MULTISPECIES: sodium-extruding oxaloacetate decarboxylase subunit alpha [Halopseudomonas]|jgi:oxaloacetate decarboxylase alpha subunit|uniref:sodium-extruding oxaloacetate decarboxylase subunit alpha n=1 Tax=Halopseudomonas TaxID=2901189 RepID=UPI000C8CA7C5|nr:MULTISPECIES: sodium-extruding oxaloacetate decarboxylase subunit alpha [Halopseudomonas]MAK74515.1 oxaloacetate decarboxylase subunit alpha [Pseudomonadales bacterium]MEE2799145.1 sodium-extruding oxaloacetate decarboxylase subunit alpha [Pseudomonadota bacterium]MCC4262092.1 sodium-extruding oxaloacetate decarboxylase subunit alpha [Halopseudomonas aestusnigri]BDX20590.1 oxaloacetate decarboxylase [Halopseudomonas aestusnigri]GMQ53623.1 sodium-extruding oxaloacetate decarboxylase subunit |tara:strand:+ start:2668 stop:4449 length:1782 start_codon:yes stop_codon:yes gene_type:complete